MMQRNPKVGVTGRSREKKASLTRARARPSSISRSRGLLSRVFAGKPHGGGEELLARKSLKTAAEKGKAPATTTATAAAAAAAAVMVAAVAVAAAPLLALAVAAAEGGKRNRFSWRKQSCQKRF